MNPPVTSMALRVVEAVSINRRAVKNASEMYADARRTLTNAITFSPEEERANAQAALDALVKVRDNQIAGAWRAAKTEAQGKRAEARIIALYEQEAAEYEDRLKQIEIDTTTS